ncbi:MAG: hypothetical protein CL678_00710 [Bdellovibrionaceae bacterium]|nr:hypothetical protein [Pseudobdellovibrionaceae bacterium]|tara:strand:- start:8157 stop:8687 length:531 start_codon:yes stop_codon:yes gene_type:complete
MGGKFEKHSDNGTQMNGEQILNVLHESFSRPYSGTANTRRLFNNDFFLPPQMLTNFKVKRGVSLSNYFRVAQLYYLIRDWANKSSGLPYMVVEGYGFKFRSLRFENSNEFTIQCHLRNNQAPFAYIQNKTLRFRLNGANLCKNVKGKILSDWNINLYQNAGNNLIQKGVFLDIEYV